MDNFTNEEKERITQLYGNDFQDIKPDDAQLIARWESAKAREETEFQAKIQAIKDETESKIENLQQQSAYAMETLEQLRDAAMERFEKAV